MGGGGGGARGGHISTVVGCPKAGPVSRDKDTHFLEQLWINQHPQIYIEDYKAV